ncbi:MAG TPA: amidohydrolase family protein [Burkholderiales bacterium]|nr:amidohydrolase family protein [Burkholderiales bacterium]
MCTLCDQGRPQNHARSQLGRRDFLKVSTAAAATTAGMSLFSSSARAQDDNDQGGPPQDSGQGGRRYVIRGGAVMTMDPTMPNKGEFVSADVLVEGKKIVAVGPNLKAGGAGEIDARGKIVMPGFVDTHHHQAWTAIRSSIPDSILIDDGSGRPSAAQNYFGNVLLGFAPKYRPEDVYISELFGGLAQLDNGVTTVHDVSQIHHSPEHSDAAIQALFDTGRRAAFGYFESAGAAFIGTNPGNQYPTDARRIKKRWFSSGDQLVHMIMGVEVYLPNYQLAWDIGRELNLELSAHVLSPFGIRPTLDKLADGTAGNGSLGLREQDQHLFIHMTGMSDKGWNRVKQVGAHVSIAFPIEMNMRHGIPPIHKMQELGIEPSLSVDVETNLTADFFTQMRSAMTMQRLVVNQDILNTGDFSTFVGGVAPGSAWPPPPAPPAPGSLPLLNVRDVLRFATINGARHLGLGGKTGSLTPGKEADIIILDATHINVFPVNHVPGAVVQMMERSNVETVIVAGKVRKWKGKLLDVDQRRLRLELENARDFLFNAVGGPPNLFR